jgi:hypothetical protein
MLDNHVTVHCWLVNISTVSWCAEKKGKVGKQWGMTYYHSYSRLGNNMVCVNDVLFFIKSRKCFSKIKIQQMIFENGLLDKYSSIYSTKIIIFWNVFHESFSDKCYVNNAQL